MSRFFWPGIIQLVLPLALLAVAAVLDDGTMKGWLIGLMTGLIAGRWMEAWNWHSRRRLGLPPPIEYRWGWPWRRRTR